MTSVLNNPLLWKVAACVIALTLPFGFWRAAVKKFSRSWFLAVHLPVFGVIALRLSCRLGWHPLTFAVLITAFFTGQLLGGVLRRATCGGDCASS